MIWREIKDMQSMVLSGGYEDDEDHGEWFLYRGKFFNNVFAQACHQVLATCKNKLLDLQIAMSLINGRWLNNRCCSRSNSQYHRSSNTTTEPEAREILGSRSLHHCILLFLDWNDERRKGEAELEE
ncbi:hypothetical protein MTR67_015425 [Solanum verrucosum]|uniref:Uncharacterized protein n=1 Tax=Solanum verrucosum TaxID=315347 RepID=A0AAF0QGT9_SOLVR|nr:hypothetical protein MTR67_015425 [Solanum verrucosum]